MGEVRVSDRTIYFIDNGFIFTVQGDESYFEFNKGGERSAYLEAQVVNAETNEPADVHFDTNIKIRAANNMVFDSVEEVQAYMLNM